MLAGIPDVSGHLAETCQSLTISVYHRYEGKYARACTSLIEYATTGSPRMLPGIDPCTQHYAISRQSTATFIDDLTRRITALHFLFIDCNATYRDWESWEPIPIWVENYPVSLVELHVSFTYTSPPPALLRDAPRNAFFPPRDHADTADFHSFDGVKKLVVWDANTDSLHS